MPVREEVQEKSFYIVQTHKYASWRKYRCWTLQHLVCCGVKCPYVCFRKGFALCTYMCIYLVIMYEDRNSHWRVQNSSSRKRYVYFCCSSFLSLACTFSPFPYSLFFFCFFVVISFTNIFPSLLLSSFISFVLSLLFLLPRFLYVFICVFCCIFLLTLFTYVLYLFFPVTWVSVPYLSCCFTTRGRHCQHPNCVLGQNSWALHLLISTGITVYELRLVPYLISSF